MSVFTMTKGPKVYRAWRRYQQAFPDAAIIGHVINVIEEVIERKWPDDTPLLFDTTVAEVRDAEGFYANDFVLNELIAAMQGRAFRHCIAEQGVDPNDRRLLAITVPYLMQTNAQQEAVLPIIKTLAIAKFGMPAKIDTQKLVQFEKRRNNKISSELGIPLP